MQRPGIQAALETLVEKAAGRADALVSIAKIMAADRPERAAALARQVLQMSPDAATANAAATLLKDMVPDWHFVIVRDRARNEAFEQALVRAVKPGSRVLDIGSGTGLLAMMAARAGAETVITCEQNAAVAGAAAKVLAANGLAGTVRLIEKHSADLDPQGDLGGPLDVVVSEIVSNNMVGQGCLPVMEQAASWLKPDGRMIPQAGTIRVALAWSEAVERRRVGVVQGFDLSPFNELESAAHSYGVGDSAIEIRSSTADLLHFDFRSGGPFPAGTERARVIADGRPANGVVQWIHLQMDDEIVYENRPEPGATSCWAVVFYPVAKTLEGRPGAPVEIVGAHDRHSLRVWVDGAD